MNDTITITIHITEDGVFTNAHMDNGNFICTVAQSNLDMSLASAMPTIREYATSIESAIAEARPVPVNDQVFIVGKGWIESSGLTCLKCGDEGRIVTKWSDDGDAENGPHPYVSEWEFCSCAQGTIMSLESLQESLNYESAFHQA